MIRCVLEIPGEEWGPIYVNMEAVPERGSEVLLQSIAANRAPGGHFRVTDVTHQVKVSDPEVPDSLHGEWRAINVILEREP